MIEKHWSAVPPVALTATGTARGRITVTSTAGFRVKQEVILTTPSQPDLVLLVNRVISPTQMELGTPGAGISDRTDLSAYGTTSFVYAREQKRPAIPLQEIDRAIYEEEPVVALRVIDVDQFGNPYTTQNPVPVVLTDGSINISTLNAELNVQLSAKDNDPKAGDVHSSVRIGDGINEARVNPDGSFNVNVIQSSSVVIPGLNIQHQEVSSVASGAETTLISIVAGPNGLRVSKAEVSGENIALFRVKIDGNTVSTKRTWWSDFNAEFRFEQFNQGLLVPPSSVLTVTVLHTRPNSANFEVTVMAE